jgi:FkbM family methyltransferase
MDTMRRRLQTISGQVPCGSANQTQAKRITSLKPTIYKHSGKLEFIQMQGSPNEVGTSSLLDRSYDNLYANANRIEVEAITGEELLAMIEGPIGACKVDVEGATLEVLQSMGNSIHRVQTFHLECEHEEVWVGQALYNQVAAFMIAKGYEQVDFDFVMPGLQSDSIWIKTANL